MTAVSFLVIGGTLLSLAVALFIFAFILMFTLPSSLFIFALQNRVTSNPFSKLQDVRLLDFLQCTDRGAYWCAVLDACSDSIEPLSCPAGSVRCSLPLLTSADYRYDPGGVTNQKLNVRTTLAAARASGGALLVTKISHRQEADWSTRALSLNWTLAPFAEAFDIEHFVSSTRNFTCTFYSPDLIEFSGYNSSKTHELQVTPGLTGRWYADNAREWRDRGVILVMLKNPWLAFKREPADEELFLSWPDWFKPVSQVADIVARAVSNPLLAGGFYGLHLRVEKDWPHSKPAPNDLKNQLLRCKPLPRSVTLNGIIGIPLYIAGGFLTEKDRALRAPYASAICATAEPQDAGAIPPFLCLSKEDVYLGSDLDLLPTSFKSFDLGALLDYEILLDSRCVRLWGARDSSFALALSMHRWRHGELATSFYDLQNPHNLKQESHSMCAVGSSGLPLYSDTTVHLFR